MDVKFSKGDWVYRMNPEIADYVWIEDCFTRKIIAHVHRVENGGGNREESIANLKLITASPTLFNALLDIYNNIDELSCEYFTKDNPLFVKAKEALNKAGLEI